MAEKYPQWSEYIYVGNRPLSFVDPHGMEMSDFYDANGTLITHVDDGSNAVFRKDTYYSDKKYYRFDGYDDSQHGENEVNYETLIQESQNLIINDPSFQPGANSWCNQGFLSIIKSIESASGRNLWPYQEGVSSANFIAEHIGETTTGFKPASLREASLAALDGYLAVGVWQNPNSEGHGHVVTFSVGENLQKGITAQVGGTNHFTRLRGGAFYSSQMNEVQYYILK